MKNLDKYIQEKYLINNDVDVYSCHPESKEELRKILEERLTKDKDANLNDIDVSQIVDMGLINEEVGLFDKLDPHNIDISGWDVSNVEDMSFMFYGCKNFNSDLSKWNVSKVADMSFMFYDCYNFNSNLNKWNVSKVKYNTNMFLCCFSLMDMPKWYKE